MSPLADTLKSVLKRRHGECEGSCNRTDVDIFLVHHNMWLCEECRDKELEILEQSKSVTKIIDASRIIDSQLTLKTDILVAKTIAAVELRAAIDNDANIPADKKDYAFAEECYTRYLKFKQSVADKRAAIIEEENEMRVWQVNTQTAAGKLRSDERDKYKELDVNYQPAPIKKQNKTTKTPTPKFSTKALLEASAKYEIPVNIIRMRCVTKGISPEQAAKEISEGKK